MIDRKAFFAALRASKLLGDKLEQSEVDGCNAILDACEAAGWRQEWIAYALATALHETAFTMQPISERGGEKYWTRLYDVKGANPARAKRMGNLLPGDGPRYRGRGFVQLTWANNYAKASEVVGKDLVLIPDLAMRPDIAARIMVSGMAEGWFTGKKLADYTSKAGFDYTGARRIINGTDKAGEIAGYARKFAKALGV